MKLSVPEPGGFLRQKDPCPCGSGRRFKKCHGAPLGKPRTTTVAPGDSLQERNVALLDALADIFKLRKAAWGDIRKTLSADHVREVYQVVRTLWPLGTNVLSMLPPPADDGLRAFYIGEPQAEYLPRGVFRFSLYCDDIVLVNPFFGVMRVPARDHPLVTPKLHRADVLKLLFAMMMLDPWIRSGIVHMIPDPAVFDAKLDAQTVAMAKQRMAGVQFPEDEVEEMTAHVKDDMVRLMKRMPLGERLKMIHDYDPKMSPDMVKQVVAAMDKDTRDDPFALDQPVESRGAQLHVGRQGVNLELALYLCHATGAFPYTSFRAVWRQLESVADGIKKESQAWGALTQAFGGLRFRFLNDVDSAFAHTLREEQRLSGFRTFLKKIWKGVKDDPGSSESERLALDFERELRDEYKRAEAEWVSIDAELQKWLAQSAPPITLATATVLGLSTISGGLIPAFAAGGYAVAGVVQLLKAHEKRRAFRDKVPMSVMLDLAKFAPGKAI